MCPLNTPLPIPDDLTHLHPDCIAMLTEWEEGVGGAFCVESASTPGREHTVHVDEYGKPILCDCFAWTKKDPPSLFVLCWHVNRVQYYADQWWKKQRAKDLAPLNGEAGVHFLR